MKLFVSMWFSQIYKGQTFLVLFIIDIWRNNLFKICEEGLTNLYYVSRETIELLRLSVGYWMHFENAVHLQPLNVVLCFAGGKRPEAELSQLLQRDEHVARQGTLSPLWRLRHALQLLFLHGVPAGLGPEPPLPGRV